MKEKETVQTNMPTEQDASREYAVRLAKVEAMRAAGIEPWPLSRDVSATAENVINEFESRAEAKEYSVAGRIMTMREHGKSIFVNIQDMTGRLQVYIKQDVIGDVAFDQFKKYIDLGDIVWFRGTSFKTRTGEITIRAEEFTLLSKCLHPLPEKFHGLTDVETIYRQRYLDLITNQESRERFVKRSLIIRTMRNYFDDNGFIEVETPMLHAIPGGAAAKPFVTHHNALDIDLYLRIAPELFLKRLVVGGLERVYEINRNFRNEGISTRHNPEFTMAEFYIAHHDYKYMMDFVENMFREIVKATTGALQVPFADGVIDYEKPFTRISMQDSVIKIGGLSEDDVKPANIDATLKRLKVPHDPKSAWGYKLVALFDELVEKKLIQPTFITDYPAEISPLTKRDPHNPKFVPRFELFIAGMEISNGYSELNEPFEQAACFREQAQARTEGDDEAHYYDADYVLALEHALPPTTGAGIGIDRFAMLLSNTQSIKDVILFPTLRPKD